MDFVNRLKKFMESRQTPITQFADNCNIPRPTISQILNGRNKKISDELIGKIHSAYPELSVVWLMFGEGEMMTTSNNQFSEGQNGVLERQNQRQSFDNDLFNGEKIEFDSVTEISPEKSEAPFINLFGEKSELDKASQKSASTPLQLEDNQNEIVDANINNLAKKLTDDSSSSKKITSIVVFYDDSTFQTFNPC